MADADEDNTIRILVATDNHLGYLDKDAIRAEDPIVTLNEIFDIAERREVDMVLLGGDLFHDNKPSRKTLTKTITLFRDYCMGDRPCQMQILSDQSQNFHHSGRVNYEDENYNIGLPVFSIHGNHDDPAGDGNLSALDILAATNLVNYFGKQEKVENIEISPVLLQKGRTRLCLYGLGAIRDERLHRTYLQKQVKMLRPQEDADAWFNLMVLHQNRVKHGATNYIPEAFLPDFLDLVVWGHEHKCEIDPVRQVSQNFFITQPGSSVATSLSEGEAEQKHVGLLSINRKQFMLEKIRLKTVRPFYIREIVLAEEGLDPNKQDQVEQFLAKLVEGILAEAKREHKARLLREAEANDGEDGDADGGGGGGRRKKMKKPLIRLRVEYSGGFTSFNAQRFGQQFVDQVANPKDILLFFRRRVSKPSGRKRGAGGDGAGDDDDDDGGPTRPEVLGSERVEDLVQDMLTKTQLGIISEKGMNNAIRLFVQKEERDSIKQYVQYSLKKTLKSVSLRSRREADDDAGAAEDGEDGANTEDEILEQIHAVRSEEEARAPMASSAAKNKGKGPRQRGTGRGAAAAVSEEEFDSDMDESADGAPAPAKGKGRKAPAAARKAGRSTGSARSKKTAAAVAAAAAAVAELEDDFGDVDFDADNFEDDSEDAYVPPSPVTRKAQRKTAASSKPQRSSTKRATAASSSAKGGTKRNRAAVSDSGSDDAEESYDPRKKSRQAVTKKRITRRPR